MIAALFFHIIGIIVLWGLVVALERATKVKLENIFAKYAIIFAGWKGIPLVFFYFMSAYLFPDAIKMLENIEKKIVSYIEKALQKHKESKPKTK